jgi:tetratricopeptide (TPR) repeat protein
MTDEFGVPVILITPASNLVSCSPFKSMSSVGVEGNSQSENDRLLIRAESFMEKENYDRALDAIEQALSIDSRYARTHYLHGRILTALGRRPEAFQAFLQAKDEDVCPLRATTPIVNAVRHVAENRSIPLVDFDRLIREDGFNTASGGPRFLDHVHPTIQLHGFLAGKIVDTMVAGGIVSGKQANAADFIGEIGTLIESRLNISDQARSLINLSQVMAWGGKFEEAGRIGEEAASLPGIDRRPQLLAEANLRVAVSEQAMGNEKRAVLFFKKSSLADPKVLEKYLRTMLEQKPGNAFFLNHLGLVLRDQDRLDEAVVVFKRAIASRPEQSGFHKNIGLLYYRLGRIGEAVSHYRQALKAPEWDLAIANNLAFLLAAHSDPSIRNPEEALKWAERCVEKTQYNSAEILDTFATVLAANNRFDEAIKWQKKAVDSAGENRRSGFQSRLELYLKGEKYEYR